MKKILFVCVENSCRSQMAEGFARALGKGTVDAYSAGSKPSGHIDEIACEVMKENGVDITSQWSKGFMDLPTKEFDYVVTMGCENVCPIVPAKEHLAWDIENPKGHNTEIYRNVRDIIKTKVENLLDYITTK